MITPLARALAVYCVQIALISTACAAAVRLIPLAYARARLVYWQAAVVLCVLLPAWPPAQVDVARAPAVGWSLGADGWLAPAVSAGPDAAGALPTHPFPWIVLVNLLPPLIIIGAVIRLAWFAAGLVALRHLAASAGEVVDEPGLLVLKERIAPKAEMYWHDRVAQPVTFGVRPPVVLLPPSLRGQTPEVARAAVCHELVHASRRHWLATLVEELLATCFWFHPGMRWMIGQVQLSREQMVDELSIAAMGGSRRAYLQALLAFAGEPALRSAPALAGKGRLAQRIEQVSQEVVMSPARFGTAATALAVFIALSFWTVASALPLRTEIRPKAVAATTAGLGAASTAAQNGSNATAVPPVGDTRPLPAYPAQALAYGVGATVALSAVVTVTGQVVEINLGYCFLTSSRAIDAGYFATQPQKPFTDAAIAALRAWRFPTQTTEGELRVTFRFDPDGSGRVTGNFGFRGSNSDGSSLPPGSAVNIARPVVGSILRKVLDVAPVYPQAAEAAGVEGVVLVEVTVETDGSVADARIVRSIPLLDQAALDAVKQWKYERVSVNGVPTPITATVAVSFSPERR